MNSNIGGNDGAHEVRAQGGTSFELPMTEQDFRVLTQKVSNLVLIMIVLLNTLNTLYYDIEFMVFTFFRYGTLQPRHFMTLRA